MPMGGSGSEWEARLCTGPPQYVAILEAEAEHLPSGLDGLEIRRAKNGHKSMNATRAFVRGSVITKFGATLTLKSPNYLSVQTSSRTHIILEPQTLQNANHSCEPNTFWDTENMTISALVDIAAGEEITFFYPASEWDMNTPFNCCCGKAGCLGHIAGAKYLPKHVIPRYRLNKHIMQALEAQAAIKVEAEQSSIPACERHEVGVHA